MHDPYAVVRNRDFALYLIGRLAASVGQQMLTVAVGWELARQLEMTNATEED